jgi:hypothetical protein
VSTFQPGQRVRCPGSVMGEVVTYTDDQVLVYLGTYDEKRVERWFPLDRVRPTIEQELEDLL